MLLTAQKWFVGSALVLTCLVAGSSGQARPSYVFESSPRLAYGPSGEYIADTVTYADGRVARSTRYINTVRQLSAQGFEALDDDYGNAEPSPLRIAIKNDLIYSSLVQKFVETLSFQKPNLMRLYRLSNVEYNKLSLMAFGILSRETKFGESWMYWAKENAPLAVRIGKIAEKKLFDAVAAARKRDGDLFFSPLKVDESSRGLTQIKNVPNSIEAYYCIDKERLAEPQAAAVATLGFLAESLQLTRNLKRNRKLDFIDDENIYDYVLYVYFGGMYQLNYKDPRTRQTPIATPSANLYLQELKNSLIHVALFENHRVSLPAGRENACR